MIERLHRHVHSQLSKYITSIRQRQAFLSPENGFSSFIEKRRGKQAFSSIILVFSTFLDQAH